MKKLLRYAAADIPASVVVLLVAVPLCLGISVASKVPEFSGIIGGIVGGIVIGLISGSHLSVSGPAAGLTAIVAAAVLKLPALEAFFLAVMIAGFFQLIMGVFKLGLIGDYVPNSVIKGMLAAIGIILILKQLPHLVGYDQDFEGDETFIQTGGENTFSSILQSVNALTPVAVLIGLLSLFILIAYETKFFKQHKIFQILSGPLLVVVTGIVLTKLFSHVPTQFALEPEHFVAIPIASSAQEFFSFFRLPDWSHLNNPDVWFTAFTLALVASLETLLGIEAIDKIDPEKRVTPPNRELIAQGTGNMISGFLGGLPLTSVIVRSSANVNAGAKTKLSAILHGVLMLICVAFLPGVLNMIPKAALAAILIFTGYKLTKPSFFKEYYRKGYDQFAPFVITIVAIVATDLLKGVLIGIATALYFVIRGNFRSSIIAVDVKQKHFLIRLRKDVSYFSKPILKRKLEMIPENASVIIDISKADFIDQDVIDTIGEFATHALYNNIHLDIRKRASQNYPGLTALELNTEEIVH